MWPAFPWSAPLPSWLAGPRRSSFSPVSCAGFEAMSRRRKLLLTGVAEGLGAEIAGTFAHAGHDVVGLSRSMKSTEHLTRRVERAGGSYIHLACDITRTADTAAAIKPHADRIDVLIHNPHRLTIKPFEQTTSDEFEQAWRVACLGAVI